MEKSTGRKNDLGSPRALYTERKATPFTEAR